MIESWYILGLIALDSLEYDKAKVFFGFVLNDSANFLRAQSRYAEADSLFRCRQKLEFLQESAQKAYKQKKWAATQFLVTEFLSLAPEDTTAILMFKNTENELQSIIIGKRILTIWSVLALAVIASLAMVIFRRREIQHEPLTTENIVFRHSRRKSEWKR
jgi:hypothetical protein